MGGGGEWQYGEVMAFIIIGTLVLLTSLLVLLIFLNVLVSFILHPFYLAPLTKCDQGFFKVGFISLLSIPDNELNYDYVYMYVPQPLFKLEKLFTCSLKFERKFLKEASFIWRKF